MRGKEEEKGLSKETKNQGHRHSHGNIIFSAHNQSPSFHIIKRVFERFQGSYILSRKCNQQQNNKNISLLIMLFSNNQTQVGGCS